MRALFQPFFAFSRTLLDPYTSFAHRLAKSANPLAKRARGLTKTAQPLALCANGNYLLLCPEVEGVVMALGAVQVNAKEKKSRDFQDPYTWP